MADISYVSMEVELEKYGLFKGKLVMNSYKNNKPYKANF